MKGSAIIRSENRSKIKKAKKINKTVDASRNMDYNESVNQNVYHKQKGERHERKRDCEGDFKREGHEQETRGSDPEVIATNDE